MKKIILFTILLGVVFTQFSCEDDTLADHRKEIRDYLESTGKIDNSIETDDGVFIYYIEEGTESQETAGPTSTVNVQYRGYLFPDGDDFDNSFGQTQQWVLDPASPNYTGLIAGMRLGLQELKKGDRAEIYIPSVLGYGNITDRPTSFGVTIEAGSILTFEVEMVSFFN